MPKYVDLTADPNELDRAALLARLRCISLLGRNPGIEPLGVGALLEIQTSFSAAMFGNLAVRGVDGVVSHIEKEMLEIKRDPLDLNEWCDLIILAMDGALRASATAQPLNKHVASCVRDALFAKMARNMQREWPDYRDVPVGQAIEHVRGDASAARKADELAVDGRPVDVPVEERRYDATDMDGKRYAQTTPENVGMAAYDDFERLKALAVGESCRDSDDWHWLRTK